MVDLIEWIIDLLLTSQTAYQKQDSQSSETVETICKKEIFQHFAIHLFFFQLQIKHRQH